MGLRSLLGCRGSLTQLCVRPLLSLSLSHLNLCRFDVEKGAVARLLRVKKSACAAEAHVRPQAYVQPILALLRRQEGTGRGRVGDGKGEEGMEGT